MSAQQILFFEKNKADYSDLNVAITASEAATFASLVADRKNTTAWQTTGSVDANNTTLSVDMADPKLITDVVLVKHNFKSYTVKYWDGASYVDFSPAINVSADTASTSAFKVAQVSTQKVQITITGTQVANSDKVLCQFLLLNRIGQLTGWPVISETGFVRNRIRNTLLSGKVNLIQNVGGFKCSLAVDNWKSDADLTIVEKLFASSDGFLVWLCGGNQSQFSSARQGYRLEDFFLMNCVNDYAPDFVKGIYSTGMKIKIQLAEVAT